MLPPPPHSVIVLSVICHYDYLILWNQNVEQVDVYGFGQVLYEMIYGRPIVKRSVLQARNFDECPLADFRPLLVALLVDESIEKNGVPTVSELLDMALFKNVNIETATSNGTVPSTPLSSSASVASLSPTSTTSTNSSTTSGTQRLFSSTKVKEALARAKEFIEKRMNEEQKAVSVQTHLLIIKLY